MGGGHPAQMRFAMLLLACLSAGCASLESRTDWWSVRHAGSGASAALYSTSHVNHGKPPAAGELQPRVLHEATRGDVSIALQYDAAIAGEWAGSAWKVQREVDKGLDWLHRLAGDEGARVVLTLVDDSRARDIERVHRGSAPVVDLVVAASADAESQSALVGEALATVLHEAAHALSLTAAGSRSDRFADEYAAALVQACYLVDTLRPGDVLALRLAAAHPPTDNYAVTQSRAATAAVVRELRALAHGDILSADDRDTIAVLHARCGIHRGTRVSFRAAAG